MQTILDRLLIGKQQSLIIKEADRYHAFNDFHYHPELELIYIREGKGTLLVEKTIKEVEQGMMILIACNIPHMFKFNRHAYERPLMREGKTPLSLKLLTLHFDPNLLGDRFMKLPENELLSKLFRDAQNGIFINGDTNDQILSLMSRLLTAPNYEHIFLLMHLFTILTTSDDLRFITAPTGIITYNRSDEKRLTRIYLYTLDNFTRTITLKEIADIVYMVPNAFCRYFKLRTNKSYFTFLMEIRIMHACKLLKEKDYSIVVVCNESGFSNLSNFNRHFKLVTGKTPMEYRKQI